MQDVDRIYEYDKKRNRIKFMNMTIKQNLIKILRWRNQNEKKDNII